MDVTREIASLEEAKLLAHPLRRQILQELKAPKSVAQLARELGQPHGKLNYHVGVLRRAGLVKLVRKRIKRGITEKLYQATAERFVLDGLLSELPAPLKESVQLAPLRQAMRQIERAVRAGLGFTDPASILSGPVKLRLSAQQAKELSAHILSVVEDLSGWLDKENKKNESDDETAEYHVMVLFYRTK